MRIESQAPTRIDLAGGTLDIWPLYLFHDGSVTVNCAISRYARCTIETSVSRAITLVSRDTRKRETFASLAALTRTRRYTLPLLAQLVRLFHPKVGFTLTTDSEAPAGAGIGGSSAMAVAICAALDRLTSAGFSRADWIHISRDAEAMVIHVPTGTQDHYPAAFGGASAIHLRAGGEFREELKVDLAEFDRRLIVCYTGKPRQSGINNWEVFQAEINGDRRMWKCIEAISQIAQRARAALAKEDWRELGALVREEWNVRRRTLPTMSTPMIDAIISAARRNGATAGKVCGAGGGGCLTLLVQPDARARVEKAIVAVGAQLLPMRIDRHGVQVKVSR
jgi:D-glycero-alpha-D-manno-heptose-7-phosphate kinase